ncbi:MAG TPA: hypothetical protein VII58_05400 [Acidobacteriaceae bacterium]
MLPQPASLSPEPPEPVVLSYAALRRAVGIVAVVLPFAVAIPVLIATGHIETSISASYDTFMRDFFVGSLCAIALFMFCCRGYDRKDVIASHLASIFATGVAFLPCIYARTAPFHYLCAASLFFTLAYFCLVLFRKSSGLKTIQKVKRNQVYLACGEGILVSMFILAVLAILHRLSVIPDDWHPHTTIFFETTSLLCFGIAWLVKGETFLKDAPEEPARNRTHTRTTDTLFALAPNPQSSSADR